MLVRGVLTSCAHCRKHRDNGVELSILLPVAKYRSIRGFIANLSTLPFRRKSYIIKLYHGKRLMKFIADIRLLLLGIWFGAAVFFVAVAQAAFAVLPQQRELAGAVVGRTLTILNFGGMTIALLLLALSLIAAKNSNRFLLWIDRLLLVVIAAACAVGQFVIGFMLSSVRAQMGGKPIDEIAADDPLRIQFHNLHEYSVWVLMAAMAAALIAFFVMANRGSGTAAKPAITNDPYNFEKEFKI
jgi:hypothetical protein